MCLIPLKTAHHGSSHTGGLYSGLTMTATNMFSEDGVAMNLAYTVSFSPGRPGIHRGCHGLWPSWYNNNNNNNHDNVYGAVIVLRALRELTRFI